MSVTVIEGNTKLYKDWFDEVIECFKYVLHEIFFYTLCMFISSHVWNIFKGIQICVYKKIF